MTAARMLPIALFALLVGIALAGDDSKPIEGSRLIVMSDGRILEGTVTRQATGYYVERPSGRIVIPFEQARCIARDLPDAYRQQREAMIDPTAADLVKFAEWCLSYRMYEEARVELHRALRRDPTSDTARRMLARVEDTLLSKPPPPKPLQRVGDGLLTPEVEALGGFSKPTAAQFTAAVQPLLIHNCGNARCHGPAAETEFRLIPVRLEGHGNRRGTEQNLAAVLKYIDFQQPQDSVLLDRMRVAHGGPARTPFRNANSSDQQKTIRDWVLTVAKERSDEDERLAERPKFGSKKTAVVQASAVVETPRPQPVESPIDKLDSGIKVPPLKSLPPRGADAFDPDEFNRKYFDPPGTARR